MKILGVTSVLPILVLAGLTAGESSHRDVRGFTRVTCSDQALLAAKGVAVVSELFSPCK
jgi:hypothetical protein